MNNTAKELIKEYEDSYNSGNKTPLYYLKKMVELSVGGKMSYDPDINYLTFEDGSEILIDSREDDYPTLSLGEKTAHEL